MHSQDMDLNIATVFFFFSDMYEGKDGDLGPISRKSRKAICEIANRLLWKADLLTCFQGNKKKNNCEV